MERECGVKVRGLSVRRVAMDGCDVGGPPSRPAGHLRNGMQSPKTNGTRNRTGMRTLKLRAILQLAPPHPFRLRPAHCCRQPALPLLLTCTPSHDTPSSPLQRTRPALPQPQFHRFYSPRVVSPPQATASYRSLPQRSHLSRRPLHQLPRGQNVATEHEDTQKSA